jgi:hypothetical protein
MATSEPAPPAAPPTEWTSPANTTQTVNGVAVTNLATIIHTQSPAYNGGAAPAPDGFITAVVVLAGPADKSVPHPSPDLTKLMGKDSLGGQYAATYSELAAYDGLTVGAVRIPGPTGPRKTLSLELGSVRSGAASTASLGGPWKVDLVGQRVDDPAGGRLSGAYGHTPLPLQTPAGSVGVRYLGTGFLTVDVHRQQATDTIYVVTDLHSGQARTVTKDEFNRLMPQPPKPFVFGTPRPEAPLH